MFWMISAVTGCDRALDQRSQGLQIPTPSLQQLIKSNHEGLQSASAEGAWPADKKICFAVSVTASDIPSNSSACSPRVGVVAGFVEAGSTLEVMVPKGSARKIELYAFLQTLGGACPQMKSPFSDDQVTHVYKVGEVARINIQDANAVVEIQAKFPGLGQHLAQQLNAPATCYPRSNNSNPHFQISSGSQTAVGGGFELKARIGKPLHANSLSGGNYRLEASIK